MKNSRKGIWIRIIDRLSEKQISFLMALGLLIGVPLLFLPIALVAIDRAQSAFTQLEVDRAMTIIENENESISRRLADWSYWDDTYHFVDEQNSNYVDNNLGIETFQNLEIDLYILLDLSNDPLLVRSIDRSQGVEEVIDFSIQDLLKEYPQLIQHDDLFAAQTGVVLINGRPLLIAARPVLTSQYEGPSRGTLIFGTWLNTNEAENISYLVRRPIVIHPFGEASTKMPEIFRSGSGSALGQTVVIKQNRQVVSGYRVITDLNGIPGFVLQVDSPRTAIQEGTWLVMLIVLLALILGLLLFSILQPLSISYRRSEKTGKEYLDRYHAVVQRSSDAILLIDSNWLILHANPASRQLLNLLENENETLNLRILLSWVGDDTLPDLLKACEHESPVERRCTRKDGRTFFIEINASAIAYLGSTAYSVTIRDITIRKEQENALRASEERYELAVRGANDGLWDWDLLRDEVYYSERWKEMLGLPPDEISSSPYEWLKRIHPHDRGDLRSQLRQHCEEHTPLFSSEHRMLHQDGTYHWMLARGVAVWDAEGIALRIAGSLTDISTRKEIEEQLRHDALHDSLTGLGNRILLIEHLRSVNERKKRIPDLIFALFFIDFDRFKQVNDTLGHSAGDQLLVEASRRLEGSLRSSDVIARFSGDQTVVRIAGDEFVILLEDFRSVQEVSRVADRLLRTLKQPYDVDGRKVTVSASIGVAVPEQPTSQVEDIIRDADIAMYMVKQKGGAGVTFFNREMYDRMASRLQLEGELRQAVEQREFCVYYQPILSLADEQLIGFEALVRWKHPTRGLLSPDQFIEVAEETGLTIPMGYQVMAEACRQMRAWQTQYQMPFVLSVNLSYKQLAMTDLAERIFSLIETTQFDPRNLWLEINESSLVENLESIQVVLTLLREKGIQFEIDDFGKGYSSLSYLQNLPVDGIKCDRTFTWDLQGSGRQIITMMSVLSRSLGLTMVVEGVETSDQADFLATLPGVMVQGYLYSRPLSTTEMDSYLDEKCLQKPEYHKALLEAPKL